MYNDEICIDVWGDFAIFTRPDSKIERVTYNFPTPSACRGILNAIYSKPKEFYYEITQIDIINPIRKIYIKKNEVQDVININSAFKDKNYCICTDKCRTQRMNTYLRDVYYRIHAKIKIQEDAPECINLPRIYAQFQNRVSKGKCFYQPYLGTRECICNFSLPDENKSPINKNENFGNMLYDVFDITNSIPLNTNKKAKSCDLKISFFEANMINGSIKIPIWGSDEIRNIK